VIGVLIAMGAELLQFNAVGGVTTVFGGGIARHPSRSLVWVGTTLGTLQRNDNADTFSHRISLRLSEDKTQSLIISYESSPVQEIFTKYQQIYL
jgi:hypothetical protein